MQYYFQPNTSSAPLKGKLTVYISFCALQGKYKCSLGPKPIMQIPIEVTPRTLASCCVGWSLSDSWIKGGSIDFTAQHGVALNQHGSKKHSHKHTEVLSKLTANTKKPFHLSLDRRFYPTVKHIECIRNVLLKTVDCTVRCCCPRALTVCKTSASVQQHGNPMVRRKGHFVPQETSLHFQVPPLVRWLSSLGTAWWAGHSNKDI